MNMKENKNKIIIWKEEVKEIKLILWKIEYIVLEYTEWIIPKKRKKRYLQNTKNIKKRWRRRRGKFRYFNGRISG